MLDGPCEHVVQADVHLGTGELQAVPDRQVLAVVGEVRVAGAPDHPGHRVETHPVQSWVRPAARPDEDGARGPPGGLQTGGLPQEGEEGGVGEAAWAARPLRPGQEDELSEAAGDAPPPHLHRPHQEVSHLPLRLQLQLVGPDELGAGEERQVVAGLVGDEGDEELHLGLPNCPPDGEVRQRAGGEDTDEGTGGLPGVDVSHHRPTPPSPPSPTSTELVITRLESFKVFNKGQVPGSVETLERMGAMCESSGRW